MNKEKIVIMVLLISSILIILGSFLIQVQPIFTHARIDKESKFEIYVDQSYQSYMTKYESHYPDNTIQIDYNHLTLNSFMYEVVDGTTYDKNQPVIYTAENAYIELAFDVEESGFYHIQIDYFPIEGKSSNIERILYLNGEIPYNAFSNLLFRRVWINQTNEFLKDENGNDIVPRQIERPKWIQQFIEDSTGGIEGYLPIYLNQGIQYIALESNREPMIIASLQFKQAPKITVYEDYTNLLKDTIDNVPIDEVIVIEGEKMYEKSSPTLYPIADRTSSLNSPQNPYQLLANTGGGFNWRVSGDWMSYQFEVEHDGFYAISIRAKQNYIRGAYVSRKLKINGEIPFEEANNIPFVYSGDFNLYKIGDTDSYLFYLQKGINEISFEVTLGDFKEPIEIVNNTINELNALYRQIIMITTAQPDIYRDYQLSTRLPDLINRFQDAKKQLEEISEYFVQVTGETSEHTVILDRIALQLGGFIEKPETIHQRLLEYQNNISALGSWVIEIREQPLLIDYIAIHHPNYTIEKVVPNLIDNLWFGINNFIASFVVDYNALSTSSDSADFEGDITVWIGTGRDQANVLRRMIDEDFSSSTNIGVKLQLVSLDVLLPSTLTGKGPDVAIGVGNQIPVNYAMRNALYDLTNFEDFDEIASRFKSSALTPYFYLDGYYALPDTQQFPVMFYRKDILEELNIDIPQTWEDVIKIIPELQRVNLDFYLPIDIVESTQGVLPPNIIFTTLLYQNGGMLYSEDNKASMLTDRLSLDAFKQWTDYYTNYRFQIQANFANRFRSGEMPIGIAYYSLYNTLSVFAPEISGNWEFTNVPGIRQEDGSINNKVPTTGTGIIMLKESKEKELSWEFMKWWTSTETQVRFGREMEGILGAAARYPTANVEALNQLPWPTKDLSILQAQWDNTFGIPEIPGSYFTGRHIDNALRYVINTGANPRDVMFEYSLIIDAEITTKRKEFDLDG
jgi:ABC-type glycerol-3-phosphate transport system substrate-binding protein